MFIQYGPTLKFFSRFCQVERVYPFVGSFQLAGYRNMDSWLGLLLYASMVLIYVQRSYDYLARTGLRKRPNRPRKMVTVREEVNPPTPARRHLYMSNQFGFPSTKLMNSASSLWPSKQSMGSSKGYSYPCLHMHLYPPVLNPLP